MNCPKCGATMTQGEFTIETSFLRFLFAGVSWQALWFRPLYGNSTPRIRVLDWLDAARGFRCEECGAALLLHGK